MEFATGGRLEIRITVADVGKRVSVRSLTGSDDQAERFTDTIGVLTSWTQGVLRITRRDGESVVLSESALVAGKPVPATPARRRGVPAAGVHELQRVAARGWPAVETASLGEWTLRASPLKPHSGTDGFTARANSVLPLGDPDVPSDLALKRVHRWYDDRGLPTRVQVLPAQAGPDGSLAAELEGRGWTAEGHAVLRVAALAPLADRAPDDRVRLHRPVEEYWLRGYERTAASPHVAEVAEKVLAAGPSVWFATVPGTSASPAAIGRCVIDGRWAGFAAIEVAPEHRRRGLATAIMAELARRALEEGASAAYLQVETGNTTAHALYDRLGFVDHHPYHYRRAPQR